MYDTIIIGGGPAGLTAAMFTCRKKMKTLVLTVDIGGQTNLASHMENYPGAERQPGNDLMVKIEKQAKHFGAQIVFGKVKKVEKKDDTFTVSMIDGMNYDSKTIILAHGKVPRSLGVKGEDEFMGKGVFSCVARGAPLFQNKTVAVIGGGNSAVEGALDLAAIAKYVYLIHRREEFRADEFSIEQAKNHPNIEIVLNAVPQEIKGDDNVSSIIVKDTKDDKDREIDIDGLFIEIGYVTDNTMVKDLVEFNDTDEIIVNTKCETSCPGIFSAGDVTSIQFKQTIIAAGEGAKAALSAHAFLRGVTGVSIDWLHHFKKE